MIETTDEFCPMDLTDFVYACNLTVVIWISILLIFTTLFYYWINKSSPIIKKCAQEKVAIAHRKISNISESNTNRTRYI